MTRTEDNRPENGSQYPESPQVAVGAVVFSAGRVLLVRRGRPPAMDRWAIPGGRVLLGETLHQAAEREVLEETGVHIRAGDPVYTFDLVERDEQGRVRFHYVIVDLFADHLGGDPVAGDDALEARWISPQEMGRLHVSSATRYLLRERFGFGQ